MRRTTIFQRHCQASLVLVILGLAMGCAPPQEYEDIITGVSGRIIDQASQAPLRDVIVRTIPPSQQVSTDENGNYRIVLANQSGEIALVASKAGYLENRTTVRVTEGQNTLLDFALTALDDSTCGDELLTTGETDIDCGGVCRPCAIGRRCESGNDCESTLCENAVCVSSCEDPRRTGEACEICRPRFDGPDCQTCSERFQGSQCEVCSPRFAGADCTECAPPFAGDNCDRCRDGRTGPDCMECTGRRAGPECQECASQFAGPECNECSERFAGPSCESCAERYSGPECTECAERFDGPDCARCSERFTGPNCRQCSERFDGPECDVCAERFTGPNCEQCRTPGMRPPDCRLCSQGGCGDTCHPCPTGLTCDQNNECVATGDPGSPCGPIPHSNPPMNIGCNAPIRPVTNTFGDALDPVCLERWPGGYCVNACIFTVNDGFECQRFNLTMVYYRPESRYCCVPRCDSDDECRDGYVCRSHFPDQPTGCVPAE